MTWDEGGIGRWEGAGTSFTTFGAIIWNRVWGWALSRYDLLRNLGTSPHRSPLRLSEHRDAHEGLAIHQSPTNEDCDGGQKLRFARRHLYGILAARLT